MMTWSTIDKGHIPPCANNIAELTYKCFVWLNSTNAVGKYKDFSELATDFGKRGTYKFFPLSFMVESLSNDEKFNKFLRGE
jgi:hypothetical protein